MKRIHTRQSYVVVATLSLLPLGLLVSCSPVQKQAETVVVQKEPTIRKEKFQSLHRSAKSIEGAASIGVNQKEFRGLLQQMATEVSIVREQSLNEKESALLSKYANALALYQESLVLWQHQQEDATWNGSIMIRGEVKGIAQKYGFRGTSIAGGPLFIPKDSIQFLWTKAQEQVSGASRILYEQ